MPRPTALVISLSDLASDPRVDRQIDVLRETHRVIAAGLGPPSKADVDYVDLRPPPSGTLRRVLQRARGALALLVRRYHTVFWRHPANRHAHALLSRCGADLVVANDVPALPLALDVAAGAPVWFDAHEYAPSEFEDRLWWRLLIRPYVRDMCARQIPRVAAMTTVSTGIAAQYERDTGVPSRVVLNAPARQHLAPTPVHDPIRLFHHGRADPGRHIERTIEAVRLLDGRFTLDLMLIEGAPGHLDELKRLAHDDPRICFRDPCPMREISRVANDFDVGVFLLPPTTLSFELALPNKLFEFVQARLAVVVGPSPEMAAVVREHGLGKVTSDFSPESLADTLGALDAQAVAEHKQAAHRAAAVLNADAAASVVRDVVAELGAMSSHAAP